MPKRIQRKRTKGWRMPEGAVYVGRPTRYGNPFNATQVGTVFAHRGYPMPIIRLHTQPSLERCIDLYTAWLNALLYAFPDFVDDLRGKDLACWCPLDRPCHADVLLEVANYEWSDGD